MNKKEADFFILHINGTPLKDIIGTTVVNSIKEAKKDKKIIVVTNFPDIWLHNPDVYRVYKLGDTPYFYDDYIKEEKSEIFAQDPFLTDDYIFDRKPLAEIWCEMIGVEFNNSKPKFYFTQREDEVAYHLTKSEKPLFFIETNDTFPYIKDLDFNWTKDLPINLSQKIADEANRRGYQVVQIRNINQPPIQDAITLSLNFRLALASLKYVKKCLFIDSYWQHAAVAFDKSATVVWLANQSKNKSYTLHKNIKVEPFDYIKERLENYSPQFDLNGEHLKNPPFMDDLYPYEEIMNALEL